MTCVAVMEAVDRLHDAGAIHPDLNLTNFLVTRDEGQLRVWIIDCDRVRFTRVTLRARQRAWRRLQRSARRLDPTAEVVRPEWFEGGA